MSDLSEYRRRSEGVYVCTKCGALVDFLYLGAHDLWHRPTRKRKERDMMLKQCDVCGEVFDLSNEEEEARWITGECDKAAEEYGMWQLRWQDEGGTEYSSVFPTERHAKEWAQRWGVVNVELEEL